MEATASRTGAWCFGNVSIARALDNSGGDNELRAGRSKFEMTFSQTRKQKVAAHGHHCVEREETNTYGNGCDGRWLWDDVIRNYLDPP